MMNYCRRCRAEFDTDPGKTSVKYCPSCHEMLLNRRIQRSLGGFIASLGIIGLAILADFGLVLTKDFRYEWMIVPSYYIFTFLAIGFLIDWLIYARKRRKLQVKI
ncbi:MAG: hypothetical protein ACFFCS_21645 [Candidatus Hodarchaeota archaeon]